MIEVEKKFLYEDRTINILTQGADFLNEKVFTDSYLDDRDFSLTTKDIWFRERSGKYELKLPLNTKIEERISDQYQELETEKDIAEYFKWNLSEKSFKNFIEESKLKPFATYTTTRRKYKKGDFTIDIDTTDFGFNIIEIEILVNDEADIQEGIDKIIKFASSFDLKLGYVRGKVIEFIQRNNPAHFQKLLDFKVVK